MSSDQIFLIIIGILFTLAFAVKFEAVLKLRSAERFFFKEIASRLPEIEEVMSRIRPESELRRLRAIVRERMPLEPEDIERVELARTIFLAYTYNLSRSYGEAIREGLLQASAKGQVAYVAKLWKPFEDRLGSLAESESFKPRLAR
jgi:hypothetical protein